MMDVQRPDSDGAAYMASALVIVALIVCVTAYEIAKLYFAAPR